MGTYTLSKKEALILGGIGGAILAAPKQADVEELKQYRLQKQIIAQRQTRIGTINLPPGAITNHKLFNIFSDAYNLFLAGYFRASAFFSVLTIEIALKSKYDNGDDFSHLITKAHDDNLLSDTNFNFLNGLRIKRNVLAHDFDEVLEDDALVVLLLTIRMLKHIYS